MQIGPDLIAEMTDVELSEYIPLHGERLRVRKFLRERSKSKNNTKRSNLLDVLRQKIETRRRDPRSGSAETGISGYSQTSFDTMRESNRRMGNRNAEKEKRKVEIGWIHKTGNKSVQVRSKKGGGTRKLTMKKDATKKDLFEEGLSLFFPGGISSQGRADDLSFDLWDYQDKSMDESKTIGEMYRETKLPVLRFYLASIERNENILSNDLEMSIETESLPDLSPARQLQMSPKTESLPDLSPPRQDDLHSEILPTTTTSSFDLLSEAIHIAGIDTDGIEDIDNIGVQAETLSESIEEFDVLENENITDNSVANSESRSSEIKEHIFKFHRGQVMTEMIEKFTSLAYPFTGIIKPQVIMPNGELEAAEDAGGVTRDVLTEFWNTFRTDCTLGSTYKVPCLRHDFGAPEWKSVAKIIAFGWESVKYFPVEISPVFMQYCFYGSFQGDILEAFLQYVPSSDAEILKKALEDVNSVDQDDLYDIFTQHELKRIPRQASMPRILKEMAHKELVQASMFIINCWGPVLKLLKFDLDFLLALYRDLIPTPKKVANLLKFPDNMSEDATATSHHLRRFIRELDTDHLKRFLRFCTGSDILTEKCIEISFVNVTGLARRPIAHTCSSLLELPKQYENYLKFRGEFMAVLNANIWVMDII